MATTYLSPGVYVEEVPSAQKAIAGVGTNTVGFIGIVPDKIKIPKPNDDYDAAVAEKDFAASQGGTPENQQKIADAKEKLEAAKVDLKKAEDDFNKLDGELKKPSLSAKDKEDLTKKADKAKGKVEPAKSTVKAAQEALDALTKPAAKADETVIKPYILEEFEVIVEPCVTKLCTNFGEYTKRFGDFSAYSETDPDKPMDAGHRALTHAVYGFFRNGGTRCFVARVKDAGDIPKALKNFESIDAVAIIAAPGCTDKATYSALQSHCALCKDRFAILDSPELAEGELDIQNLLTYDNPDKSCLPKTDNTSALYFPWIKVMDRAKRLQDTDLRRKVVPKHRGMVFVPPSGHVAGIYARTDVERGVHKAPANTTVREALNVRHYIGRPKHGLLNPQGVNVIRNINGDIKVWGARTIGGDANHEWKYVNVRRLFLYLRESIDEGTQWVVFEPNDPALWAKIRRNVSDFLTNVWRSGALFGLTPEQAFYVKCDEETNPPEVRELGQVVTEIGVAIVRPAEFVIFRVTQAGSLENM